MRLFLTGLVVSATMALATTTAMAISTSYVNQPLLTATQLGQTTTVIGGGVFLTGVGIRTGSIVNVTRSPFDGSGAGGNNQDPHAYFVAGVDALNKPNPAILTFDGVPQKSFSFLWGSPDSYNSILFSGGNLLSPVSLWSLISPGIITGLGAAFVTVTDILFDQVSFYSENEALEFSNITTVAAVPLPAGLPLLGAGLAFLTFLGWRRKRTDAAV